MQADIQQGNGHIISQKNLGIIFVIVFALAAAAFLIIVFLPKQNNASIISLVIAGTNDIHGGYYPTLLSRKDTGERYNFGGLQIMAKLIEILRSQNNNHFLYLDAGDQFQGGLQSSKLVSSGQIMTDYYNHMQTSASVPGNHEFDFSQQFLQNYLKKLSNKILSANLIDSNLSSSSPKYHPLYNQQSTRLFSFPIEPAAWIPSNITSFKVGVIGLTTVETPYKTSGFIEGNFPQSYKFLNYTNIIITQAKLLKDQGANAIIIVGHVGNDCGADNKYGIWTQAKMGDIQTCDKKDEVFALIDSLPNNTIDAIVQGHRHSTSHYFYKGIPIMGTINGGSYLNSLRLYFKLQNGQLIIDQDYSSIQGPIPVCQKIFSKTNLCTYVSPEKLDSVGQLVNWKFHNVKVQKDQDLAKVVEAKWGEAMKKYEVQIVQNYVPYPIEKDYSPNAVIGDLMTNLIANRLIQYGTHFDFVIFNSGGFRTTWYPGVIRYAQLHSMLPFDNTLSYFDVNGTGLENLLSIVQNGQKKFYPSWGLSQTFKNNTQTNRMDLLYVCLANGAPIKTNQIYTGVTLSFLVQGGDDFYNATSNFKNIRKTQLNMKEQVQIQLQKDGEITEESFKDPSPLERLIIVQ